MKGMTYLYPDARRALVKALSGKGDASVLLDGDYILTVHHDSHVSVRELSAQDIEDGDYEGYSVGRLVEVSE